MDNIENEIYEILNKEFKELDFYILELDIYNWFDDNNNVVFEYCIRLTNGYLFHLQGFADGRYYSIDRCLMNVYVYEEAEFITVKPASGLGCRNYFINLWKCFNKQMFIKFMLEYDRWVKAKAIEVKFTVSEYGDYVSEKVIRDSLLTGRYILEDSQDFEDNEYVLVKDNVVYCNMRRLWWNDEL